MNYKDVIKKQSLIILVSVIGMAVILLGSSYALFNGKSQSTNNQVITAGTLVVDYSSSNVTTTTGELIPQSESDASSYIISVNNTGTLPVAYNILIYTADTNTLAHSNIMVKLDENNAVPLSALNKTSDTESETNINNIRYILGDSSANSGSTNTHTVKVWINEDAEEDIINKTIAVDLKVEGVVEGTE